MKIGKIGMIALAACLFAGPPLIDSNWVGQAQARSGTQAKKAKKAKQEKLISRDQAASIANSATGGRVLSVQLRKKGAPKYRVKVLLEGKRVRSVSVDARSGAVSK